MRGRDSTTRGSCSPSPGCRSRSTRWNPIYTTCRDAAPKPRGGRPSILDPYRDYILARWAEGCRNAAQLYREIVERGYPGSRTIVKDFVATLRRGTPAELIVRRVRLGPRRLRRWFTCPPEKLDENERRFLDMVLEASPSAREAYSLLQEFRRI